MSTPVSTLAKSDAARPKAGPIFRGLITVLTAAIIWFSPMPAGVEQKAWHLFAIFFGTIIGLVLQPVPMGAVVLIGTTAAMLTNTLTLSEGLAGYMNGTVWLIVAAFLFARAFSKTGLGRRVAERWVCSNYGHCMKSFQFGL